MESFTFIQFIAGLLVLIAGAEVFVRSASNLASALGVPSLVIGLTVVAFGTGSPELAVVLQAAFEGQADIAIGNIVGSNIFNILLILGLSAMLAPLVVASQLVRLDVPIMIGTSVLLLLMALNHQLGRLEGAVLLACGAGYLVLLFSQTRTTTPNDPARESRRPREASTFRRWVLPVAALVIGLGFLVIGARWLVRSGVDIATAFGVSELVIGLTVIAIGTSLPEAATSIVAGIRGERDIAVGNVVGSNIFNILMVLGLGALLSPQPLPVAPAALHFDIPVMVVVAVACLPIFIVGYGISRWEGLLFFGYWIAYTLYVVLNAAGHDALPAFSRVMSVFVIPLTLLTLAVVLFRSFQRDRARHRKPGT